jgi:hypothetical protein
VFNPENLFDFFDFAVDILFCSKLRVKFSALLRGIRPETGIKDETISLLDAL